MRLSYKECLYLATLGGAQCLGLQDETGSFAEGKAFDALLVDTSTGGSFDVFQDSLEDLVEKFVNLGDDRHISAVYVQGRLVSQ